MLINKCTDAFSGAQQPDSVKVTGLTLSGGAFSAALDGVPLKQTVGQATYDCRQEIAVVVDGRWIKSDTNENFKFAFSEYCSPYCGK